MACKRCPHHVRHGKVAADGATMVYTDLCGLRLKRATAPEESSPRKMKNRSLRSLEKPKASENQAKVNTECFQVPFPIQFDYLHCQVYQETFASKGLKNGVIPTKDLHYSPSLLGIAVTDMELL